jgi:hypothetical protein
MRIVSKGGSTLKFNDKAQRSLNAENQLMGVNFHDFIQREQNADSMELASEFGLNLREVKRLKKRLERS